MFIESEDSITVHVIDIEINNVERQVTLAILIHHFLNHRVRVIAPATLLMAERPKWRHRHMTGEVRVAAKNLFNRRAVEEVVVHLAAFSAKPRALLRRLPEVKIAAIAVIEKDPVGNPALQSDIKRNRLVDRIFALGVTRRVGIPVDEGTATLIET